MKTNASRYLTDKMMEHEIKGAHLAKLIGSSSAYVYELCSGRRRITASAAVRIEKGTNGLINGHELLKHQAEDDYNQEVKNVQI